VRKSRNLPTLADQGVDKNLADRARKPVATQCSAKQALDPGLIDLTGHCPDGP
jgi:hypothetical protein